MQFHCSGCDKDPSYVVLDGCQMDDRILDEVFFDVHSNGRVEPRLPNGWENDYMQALNKGYWQKAILYAVRNNEVVMECPLCGNDEDSIEVS